MAPESISTSPALKSTLKEKSPLWIDLKIKPDMTTTAATDIRIKIIVLFLKSPNAAPVFLTNVMWSMSFITGMDSPVASFKDTRNLEYWSRKRIARTEDIANTICRFLYLTDIVCNTLHMVRL